MRANATGSRRTRLALAAALLALVSAAALVAAAALAELLPLVPSAPPDYAKDSAWLCRPGRADACASPAADPAAPIDCFYVYPTVSHAWSDNAPIAATGDETTAASLQLARFASVCRPFAPLYRQVTRHGLRKVLDDPDPDDAPRRLAYGDVLAAWHRYLAEDNHGRGVVLVGHSQGSSILERLMAAELDGRPLQARLVAAIIPGTTVDVPAGARLGGAFEHIPLCASADAPGCVIAYSTFPADAKVPDDARFVTTRTPGMIDACVNPAVVAGTPTLDADLPAGKVPPGRITARCVRAGPLSYLAIAAEPPATMAAIERLADVSPTWGLHGLDLELAEGTLIDIVRRQAAAYAKK